MVGIGNYSGEGGIRTLGSPKGYNGFRDRPDRPLWHLSNFQASIILEIECVVKPRAQAPIGDTDRQLGDDVERYLGERMIEGNEVQRLGFRCAAPESLAEIA